MKKMTKWAAVAASVVLALAATRTVALAGENAGKGDRIQHRVERMKERLTLTDDQARQLQQIFEEAHQQWQGDQGKADRETMRARHEKMQEQIKSILTPEQQEKFEAMKKEHRGRGRWNHDKDKSTTTPSNQ
jgi:Spy/CpxP family protein refolding chaperone